MIEDFYNDLLPMHCTCCWVWWQSHYFFLENCERYVRELLISRKLRPEVVRAPFKQLGARATWWQQQWEEQKLNRLRLAKEHHGFFCCAFHTRTWNFIFTVFYGGSDHSNIFFLLSWTKTKSFRIHFQKNLTYYSEKTFSHRTCNKAVLDHPKHR